MKFIVNVYKNINIMRKKDRLDEDEAMIQKDILKQTFKSECEAICPNEDELCDIVLDLLSN